MTNTSRAQELLGLSKPPIAVGFLPEPPAGLPAWSGGQVPAGCAFWLKAQQGQSFYTVPSDHHNCAVGSYTHKISLPPERANELEDTLGFMVQNQYLDLAEVPGIPTLPETPGAIAYGPAAAARFPADVIVIAATPAQAMLVYEAAIKAGAGGALTSTLGRPACAVLPLARNSGSPSLSLGCKGNRTFTGLPDGELYVCMPADKWEAVAGKLIEILSANAALGNFYESRKEQFAAG
jgi:uncharacterized protein (DUF169 family)